MNSQKIIFCSCTNTELLNIDKQNQLLFELQKYRVNILLVNDLCGLSIKSPNSAKELLSGENIILISCYQRSMKCLGEYIELENMSNNIKFFNARKSSASNILNKITPSLELGESSFKKVNYDNEWIPWFPIIDYELCVDCRKCLNFCLFGVYGTSADDKVIVTNPENCKNQCPACSRICPEGAIIFPKYGEEPINGAEVSSKHLASDKMGVNLEDILDGKELYTALRERQKKKPSLLKKEVYEQALKERSVCSCECGSEVSCLDKNVKAAKETANSNCACDSNKGCC